MAAQQDELDVKKALAGIVPPEAALDVSAGFFHRTLARWLGLPEGRQPGRTRAAPPLWDYDFWKAELKNDADGAWTAKLYRTERGQPEIVRYRVKLDAKGRIRASEWLTAPPNLVDDGASVFARATPLDPAAMPLLFLDNE